MKRLVWLAAASAMVGAAALCSAPSAVAKPTCVDVTATTTLCQTPGHARISTSPPGRPSGPQYGWPLSGVVIGFL